MKMVTKALSTACLFIQAVFLFLSSCVPVSTPTTTSSKVLLYENHEYESVVGNVILNSFNPFAPLRGKRNISLEFDLLNSKFEYLQASYIHCTYDWKPSPLQSIQYIDQFNLFDQGRFDYSVNSKQAYVQYYFNLPRPKLSGNYLVIVHRRGDPKDVLFSRRIIFYENRITIDAELKISTVVKERPTHQQLDFSIDYQDIEAPNPARNFRTVVFQNKDWNRTLADLKPTNIQPGAKRMEWYYFSGETTFPGWNQFRFLDLRTLNVRGQNIVRITKSENKLDVYPATDSRHGSNSYRELINDNNGRFIPGNSDPGESWLEADYANVHVTLKSDRIPDGKVYITGWFNQWKRNDANIMQYDAERGLYYATLSLKQGYYDYRFELESKLFDRHYFEGSHFQTENEYDILVYYRAPGKNYDEVLGFRSINSTDYY